MRNRLSVGTAGLGVRRVERPLGVSLFPVAREAIVGDQKDASDAIDAIKDASDAGKDASDARKDASDARNAMKNAIVDSVDDRLGAMIDRANTSLQHPSGMIQVDGRWAMPVTTPDGLPTGAYRWAANNELPQTEDSQIGKSVAEATLQEVTLRTRAIMTKVALNPGNVLAYEWVSRTMDPATGRPMFEGDFVNWCIAYAMARGYGILDVDRRIRRAGLEPIWVQVHSCS